MAGHCSQSPLGPLLPCPCPGQLLLQQGCSGCLFPWAAFPQAAGGYQGQGLLPSLINLVHYSESWLWPRAAGAAPWDS